MDVMPHIHTESNQYDFTASGYIVRLDKDEPRLVLHKHKKLNKYLQFGGHVELNENPWSAVTHEISEESGYAMTQLKLLQPTVRPVKLSSGILHPFPVATLSVQFGDTDHFHTDIAYAFVARESPVKERGEDESDDIRDFTVAELAAVPVSEIPEDVREIGLYVLEECLAHWIEVDCAGYKISNPTDD